MAATIAVVVVAVVCAFILQLSTHLDFFAGWRTRASSDVLVEPLDVAFIATAIAGAWALLGRLKWALALVTGSATLLAGISHSKVVLRHEPLFPADHGFVSNSGSLLGMVDPTSALGIAIGVVGAASTVAVIGRLISRLLPQHWLRAVQHLPRWRLLAVRGITLAVSLALLLHGTQFNKPNNLWRTLYDQQADWMSWSQLHNYRSNGFVGGFLYNMPAEVMGEPGGYDAEAMAAISAHYSERADQINAERTGSLADANVVFILSESFSDPSRLAGFTLAENPIPVTQRVMAQNISGTMYAQSYGGGTSTMEFESLTGQSVGLFNSQVTSPYQMMVGDQATYPSMVGAFAELGHRTVAIHSFSLDMYKRKQVYVAFGFDEVIDDAAMQSQEIIGDNSYLSDAAAFDEVLHQLDRHDGREFVNLVTMQNHGTYYDLYPDPIESDIPDPERAAVYGQYARGLAHTDSALADFLAQLQARDETTIVVFYGDHQPGIIPQDVLDVNEPDAAFRTPFFVWNSSTRRADTVDAIGPAMFLPLVHESADAPVSPYLALLDEARHAVPVIQPARTLDAHGSPVDLDALDPDTAATVEALRMVQYDFSVGERHAVGTMWPGAIVRDLD